MKKLKLKKTKKSNFTKKLLIGTGFLVLTFLAVSGYYLARYGVGPLTYFTIAKPTTINCVGDCWYEEKVVKDVVMKDPKTGVPKSNEERQIELKKAKDTGTPPPPVTFTWTEVDRKDPTVVTYVKETDKNNVEKVTENKDGTHTVEVIKVDGSTGKNDGQRITTTTVYDNKGNQLSTSTTKVDVYVAPPTKQNTTTTPVTTTINCNVTCATIGSPVCSGSYVMSGAGWSGGSKSAGGSSSRESGTTDRECMLCGADGNYSGSESCGYLLEKNAPVVLGPDMNSDVFGGMFSGTTGSCFEKRGGRFVQLPFGATGEGGNSSKVCGANGAWVDKPQLSASEQAKLDQAAKAQEIADRKQACEAGGVNTYYPNSDGSYSCLSPGEIILRSGQASSLTKLTAVQCHTQHPGYISGADGSCKPNILLTPAQKAAALEACKAGLQDLGGTRTYVTCDSKATTTRGIQSYNFCTGGGEFINGYGCAEKGAGEVVNPNGVYTGGESVKPGEESKCIYDAIGGKCNYSTGNPKTKPPLVDKATPQSPANPATPTNDYPNAGKECGSQPSTKRDESGNWINPSCGQACGGLGSYIDNDGKKRCNSPDDVDTAPTSNSTPTDQASTEQGKNVGESCGSGWLTWGCNNKCGGVYTTAEFYQMGQAGSYKQSYCGTAEDLNAKNFTNLKGIVKEHNNATPVTSDNCPEGSTKTPDAFGYTCVIDSIETGIPATGLTAGESCVEGSNSSCDSGDCRSIRNESGSRDWYCMKPRTVRDIINPGGYKNGWGCNPVKPNECESGYCADNLFNNTCEPNPFKKSPTPNDQSLNITPDPGATVPQVAQTGTTALDTGPLVSNPAVSNPAGPPAANVFTGNETGSSNQYSSFQSFYQGDYKGNGIDKNGCYLTVASMIIANYGTVDRGLNPDQLNKKYLNNNYVYSGYDTIFDGIANERNGIDMISVSDKAKKEGVVTYVANNATLNRPVSLAIYCTDCYDGGHFVLAVGKNEKGEPLIYDPLRKNQKEPVPLNSQNYPGLNFNNDADVHLVETSQ